MFSPAPAIPTRIAGLDGVRGLAALFVVLHHTHQRAFPGYPANTGPAGLGWLLYGHFAVVVFIVLSGFSLALAPARHGWRLDGVGRFTRRRVWRIVPAYWAALLFSVVLAGLVAPPPGQPGPTARATVVHGLLLQDAIAVPTPNRALWSIAVEAHLYLFFPLLLLLVRRVHALVMPAVVTVLVASVGVLAEHRSWAEWLLRLTPQLAALFAVGVLAAGFGRLRSWPWHWFALVAVVPVLALIVLKGSVWALDRRQFWVDLALGPAIGCGLAAIATGRPAVLVRVLDSGPLRRLGAMSYSLYLIHAPIVVVLYALVVTDRVPRGLPAFLVGLALVLPVALGVAWLLAVTVELPYQRYRCWNAPWVAWRARGGEGRPEPDDQSSAARSSSR